MRYQRQALRGLATLHRQRIRLLRAASSSCLLFMPALLIASCNLPMTWIFPFTLTAAYSMMIVLLAGRLGRVSLLGLPGMQLLGQFSHAAPWLMPPLPAGMLLLMGLSARHGLHKGLQFWVFALLLNNMMPPLAMPAWQHGWLTLSGALYGWLIARHGLQGWPRVLPGASMPDTRRYAWHLVLWGCLGWLAATHLHLPHTWWLPVLVVGIIDPSPKRMMWLVKERVYGTLHGGLLATLLGWWQPLPAIHMLILCLTLSWALMCMQRSFRGFIACLTLLVLSAMPVAQVEHGAVERIADTVLVGVLLLSLAWWLETGIKTARDTP